MSQFPNNNFYNYANRFSYPTALAPWGYAANGGVVLPQHPQLVSPPSSDERSPLPPAPAPAPNPVKSELASLFGSYADMRAGNGDSDAEVSLGEIFDLATFLSDSDSTPLDSSGVSSSQGMSPCASPYSSEDSMTHLGGFDLPYIPGVSDSAVLASQLQSFLAAQYYGTNPPATTETIDQIGTVIPEEVWRGSTPTYVPPSSFDLPVPSPITNDLATGTNHGSAAVNPSSQSNPPSSNPVPSSTPSMGDSAPGPPGEDYSASPSVDVEIKTEPDLETEDGRPIRSMPSRSSKSRRRIPLDAPIQQRNYNGPSRTAAKPLPKGFEKSLPPQQAAGVKRKLEADVEEEEADEDEDDPEFAELARTIKDKVALKRAKNTLAARKSRARKAAYLEELEVKIAERDARIADLERMVRERNVEIRMLKELQYPDGM